MRIFVLRVWLGHNLQKKEKASNPLRFKAFCVVEMDGIEPLTS